MRSYVRYGSGAALVFGLFAVPVLAQSDSEDVNARLDEMEERIDMIDELTASMEAGSNRFLLSGYAFTNYTDQDTMDSSFNAGFNPIFQWRINEDVFAAAEIEFELGGSSTAVNFEFMDMNFIVNDWLTLQAGKLLSPTSTFKEQMHPAWINKLPDQPLFAGGDARLIPTSILGVEARGAVPVGDDGKFTYSIWVENGPQLVTTGTKTGQLNFSNFSDVNDNKAFGARFGFFPTAEFEVAYSILIGDVGATGTVYDGISATIHDVSFGFVAEDESIGGRFNIAGEYIKSDVDDIAYGGTPIFNNEREAGYIQAAYRPTLSTGNIKNLEFVTRYDVLDNPSTATVGKAYRETRWTLGVNYWITPNSVVKFAYQFDDISDPLSVTNKGNDAFLAQYSIGF